MFPFRAAVFTAVSIVLATTAQATEPAVWAKGSDDRAIDWLGSKSKVTGLVVSNSGITVAGAKNTFVGGTHFVTTFLNSSSNGSSANVFNPGPQQIQSQTFPA